MRKHSNGKSRVISVVSRQLGFPSCVKRQTLVQIIADRQRIPVPLIKQDQWALLERFAFGKTGYPPPKKVAPRLVRAPQTTSDVASVEFLQSYAWRRLRMVVLAKRGARCECCGASPNDGVTVINVDHIKPRKEYPYLALVESNLQILCHTCNHGKGNWDETDWRKEKLEIDMTLDEAVTIAERYKM
jgi:5-methylcytosine-specific restriction endonuclease McrA